jgi:hypothetical protein
VSRVFREPPERKKRPIVHRPVYSDKERKALFILNAFTPGEIQSKTSLQVPHKVGRKYDSPILMRTEFTPGTGIPASTIKRFQDGTYKKMGPITVKKLSLMYDKYQYAHLRSVGANKENARSFCKQTPEKLLPKIYRYQYNARRIQHNYKQQGIDKVLYHIQWGMAHSHRGFNDWDQLAKISGLSKYKPARKRRKKGYGSHRQ